MKNTDGLQKFIADAQGGEFHFGSNIFGWFDPDTPNAPVYMKVHNVEEFTYASLTDCYNHYMLEQPTQYEYSTRLGEWLDDNTLDSDCPEFDEPLKRLLPERENDEAEIWSDPVAVSEPATYSQRRTPVHFKGEVIDPG
jgi:hypothetical protein